MSIVLVTGAAGFIGSHVTERLLQQGNTVIGVDNFDAFYPRSVKARNIGETLTMPNFHLVESDIRDQERVWEIFARFRPDAVIHLAARAGVRSSIQDPAAYYETNVKGTLHLLTACQNYPVGNFVFASSSSVYGDSAHVPVSEGDTTDCPASPYAATKKAGEVLCFTYHRLLNLPITCLRFFTVFGPRQRPDLAIAKFVDLIAAGERVPFFGDGSTSRDYTYIDDTVNGILAALDKPADYAIYNLGNSSPVTLCEMINTLERTLNKKARLEHLPGQPGDVRTTYADIRKAQTCLGYAPSVCFEEGIQRYVAWWQSVRGAG